MSRGDQALRHPCKFRNLAIFYHEKKSQNFQFSVVFTILKRWIDSTAPPPPLLKTKAKRKWFSYVGFYIEYVVTDGNPKTICVTFSHIFLFYHFRLHFHLPKPKQSFVMYLFVYLSHCFFVGKFFSPHFMDCFFLFLFFTIWT